MGAARGPSPRAGRGFGTDLRDAVLDTNIDRRRVKDDRTDPETTAIEALAQDYFLGTYEGGVERLRRIFHPRCWLFGERGGESQAFPLSCFLEFIETEPAPKTEREPFDMRVASIDRTGSVAVTKVEDRYQGRWYTDYLMLQKAAEGWRIVAKAFITLD